MTDWHLQGKVLVVMVVLSLSSPVLTRSESPTPTTQQVRGEIFMMTSELVVVAVDDGSRVLFQLGKDTRVDPTLKVGDRVEVLLAPDQRVISVTKLSPEVRSRRGGASPDPLPVSYAPK